MPSRILGAMFAAVMLLTLGACEQKQSTPPRATADETANAAEAEPKVKEAVEIATDAYVYAYPLVTMEYTRRAAINVERPKPPLGAPMGQLVSLREYPTAAFESVTAPNADTLYTSMWLDVTKEPWILSLTDMKGRYALFPLLDGWTTVFQVPGKRTTAETRPHKYAITGTGWSGTLPACVTEYKSPTGLVWMIGRIYCTGTPADYKAVHAPQNQGAAIGVRQALYASTRQGRFSLGNEDAAARPGQRTRRWLALQAVCGAVEDQPTDG